jgi:hypothetical protein
MKNTAKCDNYGDSQFNVIHRNFECKWRVVLSGVGALSSLVDADSPGIVAV